MQAAKAVTFAGAIAAGMYVAAKAFLPLIDEEHSFVPTSCLKGGRKARTPFGSRLFKNKDGLFISWREWIPVGTPKGLVILCHGFGEHSGRYEHLAQALVREEFAVYALDHQGHGASEGDRAYVKKFQDYCDDLLQFTTLAKCRNPGSLPVFLIGHSMGGAIALQTAIMDPALWAGIVLSGPLLVLNPKDAPPHKIAVARMLSYAVPKLSLDAVDALAISHDPNVVSAYLNDPLVYKGGTRVRLAVEVLSMLERISESAPTFSLPFLVQHGAEDTLCMPEGSVQFFKSASTTAENKKIVIYHGLRHEIYNEALGRDPKNLVNDPIRDALVWIKSRL